MADYVMLNGQLTPYESAWVPAGDAGLLHGAGATQHLASEPWHVAASAQKSPALHEPSGLHGHVSFPAGTQQENPMPTMIVKHHGT